eukprot:7699863-Heterocapsa_arctica.AAC.1
MDLPFVGCPCRSARYVELGLAPSKTLQGNSQKIEDLMAARVPRNSCSCRSRCAPVLLNR